MKCWSCKQEIRRAWRVPVITREVERFRDFCDDCYQKVKEAREWNAQSANRN